MIKSKETCFECGHTRITYSRKLPTSDLPALAQLYRIGEWAHIDQLTRKTGGGDFAKFEFWSLIEAKRNANTRKRTSGVWRMTECGRLFMHGHARVRPRVVLCENQLLGFEGPLISVVDASKLGGFDYAELMLSEGQRRARRWVQGA